MAIPNLLIDHAVRNTHVPVGLLARREHQPERHLHGVLHRRAGARGGQGPAGVPPRACWRRVPKHLAVLNAAAEKAELGQAAAGRACSAASARTTAYGSYTAAVAEVSVSPQGRAEDPSHRRGDRSRLRGQPAADRGAGAGLVRLRPERGAVRRDHHRQGPRRCRRNFDTYPVMRMADMPKVETVIVPSGGFWGGVGEPTIAVAAPAVLNAIFAATGKRIRTLPLRQHDLRARMRVGGVAVLAAVAARAPRRRRPARRLLGLPSAARRRCRCWPGATPARSSPRWTRSAPARGRRR